MSANYANTGMKTLSLFNDSIIDNAVLQNYAGFTSRFLNL